MQNRAKMGEKIRQSGDEKQGNERGQGPILRDSEERKQGDLGLNGEKVE